MRSILSIKNIVQVFHRENSHYESWDANNEIKGVLHPEIKIKILKLWTLFLEIYACIFK